MVQRPTGPMPTAAPAPSFAPQTQPNVFGQSAGAYNAALQGTMAAGMAGFNAPQAQSRGYNASLAGSRGYNASLAGSRGFDAAMMAGAPQVSATSLSPYMNPFTQSVIDNSLGSLNRARQMSMNDIGAQAQAARAFGGSRQGVLEAETNRGFADQAGQLASGLNLQNFQNAQGMAQFDIGNSMAQMAANQNALNNARQFGSGAFNTAQLANANAINQSRQFGANAFNNASMANAAARNAAGQFNASAQNAASIANQSAGLQGAQLALQSANQMGNLSQMGFNMGNTITQQQMQRGQMQQATQQALIDAARGQFSGFTGAPMQSLSAPMAALSGANMGQQSQTSSSRPGLFDFLTLGAMGICWVAREVYGEEDPRWQQFRHWLLTSAPAWLRDLYIKHGEAFAGVVRKVPALKRVLRPLMDRARKAAGFEG
jgi:hypothetical protein